MMHFHPCPKVTGLTRAERKQAKKTAQEAAERACYRAVDQRDGHACRVCKRLVGGNSMLDRAHHHHLVYRSRGGEHASANVITVCKACHDAIHVKATVRLEGDADLRDARGKLHGVKVSRLTEAGWTVEKWV